MTEQPGHWYELTTWADSEAIESVAELFARYGYNEGVSIEEPFLQEQDGDNLRIDISKPAVIRTYIPAESYDPATSIGSATASGISAKCARSAS